MIRTSSLKDKARLLLTRRDHPATVGGYLRENAARHVIFAAIFWTIIALVWSSGHQIPALIIGGFWAGRLMRDVQWYQRLVAEWESTRELIDWDKVDELARAGSSAPKS